MQPDALLVLAEFEDPEQAAIPVIGPVGLMGDGERHRRPRRRDVRRARAFAGYAGWGPGQLDAELARDDWFVAPAGIDDIFDPDAEELWQRVLARKGGHFARRRAHADRSVGELTGAANRVHAAQRLGSAPWPRRRSSCSPRTRSRPTG